MKINEAGYRVTGLIPDRPDVFLTGMQAVFTTSASICLAAGLLTGWRMYQSQVVKRAVAKEE